MKIPLTIVEDHSDCLYQIQRLLARNKLPLKGFTMLHFDSHPDLCVSPEFKPEHLESAEKMREPVSIESWIMPLSAAKHLSHVIWVRPPWSDQLQDGVKNVKVGFAPEFHSKEPSRFACSWPTEYFTSDGTFAKETDIEEGADLRITTTLCEKIEDDIINGAWFLDIDLDYFSVDDPFIEDLGQTELKKVSDLFATGEAPLDHLPLEEHESYQVKKHDKLAKFNKNLKEWDSNREKFDAIDNLNNVDEDINELF